MTKSKALSAAEKTTLSSNIASLNHLIIIITKQILVVQQDLSILIGAPYPATFLAVKKIDLVIFQNILEMIREAFKKKEKKTVAFFILGSDPPPIFQKV